MKVLQINFSDYAGGGGGAIAMYRLYTGLKRAGVDCKILSGVKTLPSQDSQLIPRKARIEKFLEHFTAPIGLNDIHRIGAFLIKRHPFYQEADIFNFHVLHSGFFSYLAIPLLTQQKPAVWIFHDMWGFTGHCAYSYDCERWKTGCGQCPYLNTYPAIRRDNTHLEWKLKRWVYNHSQLTIVTPSRWLAEQARQSMFNRFSIYHIPHGIDPEVYQPRDPEHCRSVLGIPTSKKVVMFGAVRVTDPRKGGDLLLKALQHLPKSLKTEILLITIGQGGEEIAQTVGMDVLNFGYVSSDILKTILYSAADLFLFPTRADNLGLVLLESMACGTPLVSFNVGGVSDLVRQGITGYLAHPENIEDFSNGIMQLLEDTRLRERMSQQCRTITLQEYPLELQVQRYIELYHRILEKFS